jgi:hypothetical protein
MGGPSGRSGGCFRRRAAIVNGRGSLYERPMTEPTIPETLTLTPELSAALDVWIGAQPEPRLSRAEAIQRLLADALGVGGAGSIPVEELNASNDE